MDETSKVEPRQRLAPGAHPRGGHHNATSYQPPLRGTAAAGTPCSIRAGHFLIIILIGAVSWSFLMPSPKVVQMRSSSANKGAHITAMEFSNSIRSRQRHGGGETVSADLGEEELLLETLPPARRKSDTNVGDRGNHWEMPVPSVERVKGRSRNMIPGADDQREQIHRDVGLNRRENHPTAVKSTLSKQALPSGAEVAREAPAEGLRTPPPLPETTRTGDGGSLVVELKIDLVIYVIFQSELRGAMYQGMQWDWIPRLDEGMETPVTNTTVTMGSEELLDGDSGDDASDQEKVNKKRRIAEREVDMSWPGTREVITHMIEEEHERDRTRVAFVAINPHRERHYRILPSQLLPSYFTNGSVHSQKERVRLEKLMRKQSSDRGVKLVVDRHRDVRVYPVDFQHTTFLSGRVLREWEMPGYFAKGTSAAASLLNSSARETHHQQVTAMESSNQIHHHLEEFGAMTTLYHSGLTLMHSSLPTDSTVAAGVNGSKAPRRLAADADGDGVQEWMGVFHNDMRLDVRLIQLIRRRIRQGTARFLGLNASSVSDAPRSNPNNGGRKAKIMFGGRVVQRAPPESTDQAFLGELSHRSLPKGHHCCVFYSGAYPAVFLFKNALGYVLLEHFNSFFTRMAVDPDRPTVNTHQNITFERLCAKPYTDANGVRHNNDAILEAFVIPNALFNGRVYPFLEHAIDLLTRKRFPFPSPEMSVEDYHMLMSGSNGDMADIDPNSMQLATVTDVLERALALALGHAPKWLKIRLPVRHARDFVA